MFRTVAALAFTLLGGFAVMAMAPKSVQLSAKSADQTQSNCRFAFDPQQTNVAAFGVYEGKHLLSAAIGNGSHEAYVIPIVGPTRGPHRVLLLLSYEAIVWDFSRAPVNRIDGVVVSGYYDQAVANLPDRIPVKFSSGQSRGPCGRIGYAYQGGPGLEAVVTRFREATGLGVESFSGGYNTEAVYFGSALEPALASMPAKLGNVRAAVPVVAEDIPPREAGIAKLILQGKLRAATQSDVDRWNRLATGRLQTGQIAPYRNSYLDTNGSYVVLAPIRVPRGMHGSHSAHFLIAPGVPDPVDPGSHNSYYRLGDGTCYGADPDCRSFSQ